MKRKGFIVLLLVSFLFRLALVPIARHGDVNNNTSWGQLLLSRGSVGFYENKVWPYSSPNQPPLYLYTFATTSFFQNLFSSAIFYLNEHVSLFPSSLVWTYGWWGELYFAKLPGILADFGIAIVICKFFEKKQKLALSLAIVWLVNPVSWYLSGIWGGTDSIVNFLGLLSIYFLFKKGKLVLAVLFFLLSLLFKGSLAIFLPILLLVVITKKYKAREWVKAAVVSALVVFAVSFPFHPNIDLPVWFLRLYAERFLPGEIGSLTANAFNFWWIVDPGKTLDSTVYFGLAARMWGYLAFASVYLYAIFLTRHKLTLRRSLLIFCLVALTAFLFMTRIHERYLYPFFPIATVALAYFDWFWVPYVVLSITELFNLYHLFWAPGIPALEAWYLNPSFMVGLSALNIVVFAYIVVSSSKN